MRANHYKELLKAYHDSLKNLLEKLGENIKSQFPFKAFENHLKKFGQIGALLASFMVHILVTKREDLPDFEFIREQRENKEVMKAFLDNFSKQDEGANERVRQVIEDIISYGYL